MRIVLLISLILVVNLNCQFAKADWLNDVNPTPYFRAPFSSDGSPSFNRANDTSNQQEQVLEKINEALSRGTISPDQASDFKAELNKINEQEAWHKSYGQGIPSDLLKDDQQRLNVLMTKLDHSTAPVGPKHSPSDAMHVDIHKMISQLLAAKKITDGQAEQYYARLAQLELDQESLKNDPVKSNGEAATLNQLLNQLKQDLERKARD
jgi:hypothetical protein